MAGDCFVTSSWTRCDNGRSSSCRSDRWNSTAPTVRKTSISASPITWRSSAADAVSEFPVIVAPPVTYGFTHYNMGEVGTISLRLETFIDVLCDVSRSIWANGFHRLILLNGHGGNEQPTWSAAVKLGRRRRVAAGADVLEYGAGRAIAVE